MFKFGRKPVIVAKPISPELKALAEVVKYRAMLERTKGFSASNDLRKTAQENDRLWAGQN